MLEAAGLKKNDAGIWTWKDKVLTFEIMAPADFEMQSNRLAYACADQWRSFGFDVTVQAADQSVFHPAANTGDYTAGSYWPACGVQLDFYGNLSGWHKDLIGERGKPSAGAGARLASDRISELLDGMAKLPTDDPEIQTYAFDLMKAFVEEAAWLPMFGTTKLVPVNNTYWTNYVSAKNPYDGPWWWWSCFKFQMPEITAVAQ